jgi:hypothetical protein
VPASGPLNSHIRRMARVLRSSEVLARMEAQPLQGVKQYVSHHA